MTRGHTLERRPRTVARKPARVATAPALDAATAAAARNPGALDARALLRLQATAGNAAVGRMLRTAVPAQGALARTPAAGPATAALEDADQLPATPPDAATLHDGPEDRHADREQVAETPEAAGAAAAALDAPEAAEAPSPPGAEIADLSTPAAPGAGTAPAAADVARAPIRGPPAAAVTQSAPTVGLGRTPAPTIQRTAELAPLFREKRCKCGGRGGPECTCGGHANDAKPAPVVDLDVTELEQAQLSRAARAPPTISRAVLQRFGLDDVTGAIGGAASAVGGAVKGAASAVGGAVKGAASAVGGAVKGAAGAVGGALSSMIPADILDFVKGAPQKARAALQDAQGSRAKTQQEAQQELQQTQAPLRSGVAKATQQAQEKTHAERSEAGKTASAAAKRGQELQHRGTNAAKQIKSMSPHMEPLLDPGKVAGAPQQVAAAATKVADAGAKATGNGAVPKLTEAEQKAKELKAGGFTCDEAEVMAMASGVARQLVNNGLQLIESATGIRADRIKAFAGRIGKKVGDVANTFKGVASELGKTIKEKLGKLRDAVMEPVKKKLEEAKKAWTGIKEQVSSALKTAKEFWSKKWAEAKTKAVAKVKGAIDAVKNKVGWIVKKVEGLKKSKFWPLLAPLAAPLIAIAAPFYAAIKAGELIGKGIARVAKTVKENGRKWLKDAADKAVKAVARGYQWVKTKLRENRAKLKAAADEAIKKYAPGLPGLVADAKKWAQEKVGDLKKATSNVANKVLGKTCAKIEPYADICADQYLPDLGAGTTNARSFKATKDATVPLDEFGVPANLKVSKGSSLEVSRKGTKGKDGKTFKVKITGESELLLNKEKKPEKGDVKVSVNLPSGNKGNASEMWKRLGGGGGAAAAPGGGGAAAAPGGGGAAAADPSRAGAKIEGGMKGEVETVYEFTAGATNCDGVGGMVALMAAFGLSGVLPEPLGSLVGGAAQGSFTNNMLSCTFKSSAKFGAKGEIELGKNAKLEGAMEVGAEQSIGLTRKKLSEELTDEQHLKIYGKLSGSAALELDADGLLKDIGGKGELGAKLEAELKYVPNIGLSDGMIVPTEIGAELSGSISAKNFDPETLRKLPGAVEAVRRALGAGTAAVASAPAAAAAAAGKLDPDAAAHLSGDGAGANGAAPAPATGGLPTRGPEFHAEVDRRFWNRTDFPRGRRIRLDNPGHRRYIPIWLQIRDEVRAERLAAAPSGGGAAAPAPTGAAPGPAPASAPRPGASDESPGGLQMPKPALQGQEEATLEGKVGYKVSKVETLPVAIEKYLGPGADPEQVSADGLLKVIRQAWDGMPKALSVELKFKESQKVGVNVGGSADLGSGMVAEANMGIGTEHTVEHTIFEYSSAPAGD